MRFAESLAHASVSDGLTRGETSMAGIRGSFGFARRGETGSLKTLCLRFAAVLLGFLPAPALAQLNEVQLPEVAVVSPGGVDLASGFYRGDTLDLALGDEASGGITFRRVMRSDGTFRNNWYRYLKVKSRKEYYAGAVTGTTPMYHLEGVDGGTTFAGPLGPK